MDRKQASSEAAWALITEGVTSARLETHRLRHLISRGMTLAESSEAKEHIYQVAGDIIMGLPQRLSALEIALDRTALALSKMGDDYLSARLPLSDKTLVDEAIESAGRFKKGRVDALVQRWMERQRGSR